MDYSSLEKLVKIDSPSGFTAKAEDFTFSLLSDLGWRPKHTNKRAVTCQFGDKPRLAIAAHLDTLGGVVKEIKDDGTLGLSRVGGLSFNAYEGAYCRIHTIEGKQYTGTFLINNPAVHVNPDLRTAKREEQTMHIRLDEEVSKKDEVKKLGIRVGDFICFETHYEETPAGFIKSKYMDNKAGCFVLYELAKQLKGKQVPVEIFFSNFEEVGHGGTVGYAETIEELLVIDMGVVGSGCAGKETACSICAKDSTGPYDYEFRKRLVKCAEEKNIPFEIDIYPFYGSDGSAALSAGNDFRVGLIGPGVSASHGIERTHKKGIEATVNLCLAYIEKHFAS